MMGPDSISLLWEAAAAGAITAPTQPGSVPPGDGAPAPMTDIHDIKPLLDIGGDWQWLLYLAGGSALLLLCVLAWWLWKRRRGSNTQAPDPMPEVAPDEEALAAIDALAVETGLAPKQFYFRLSAILRRYVERRFRFPAAEMTTEELLPQVDRLLLDPSLVMPLKRFCKEADPIKFAGAAARKEQAERNLSFCRDFVRKTTDEIKDL